MRFIHLIKKNLFYIIVIIIIIIIGVLGYRWSLSHGIENITTNQLASLLEERNRDDLFFVDVRETHEYRDGHIEEFSNIPLSIMEQELELIPKEKTVVIICRSGNRSLQAANILKDLGYNHLINVKGGMLDWQGKVIR